MVGYILGMAAEEFVAESQKPFYKMAYKTSRNKGKRIFNSIQLNLFTLSKYVSYLKNYTKLTEYQLFCWKNEFLQKLKIE